MRLQQYHFSFTYLYNWTSCTNHFLNGVKLSQTQVTPGSLQVAHFTPVSHDSAHTNVLTFFPERRWRLASVRDIASKAEFCSATNENVFDSCATMRQERRRQTKSRLRNGTLHHQLQHSSMSVLPMWFCVDQGRIRASGTVALSNFGEKDIKASTIQLH